MNKKNSILIFVLSLIIFTSLTILIKVIVFDYVLGYKYYFPKGRFDDNYVPVGGGGGDAVTFVDKKDIENQKTAIESGNFILCNSLPKNGPGPNETSCIEAIIVQKKDANLCSKYFSNYDAKFCLRNFAIDTKDRNACYLNKDKNEINTCLEMAGLL